MLAAAELVSLAASRGIDLSAFTPAPPARVSSRPRADDGVEWVPLRGSEQRRPPPRSVNGEGSVEWVPLPWLAVRYSLAGEVCAFWPLWRGLVHHGSRLATRDKWPPHVRMLDGERRFYLESLARLALSEARLAALFAAAPVQLPAACLNVSDGVWAKSLAGCYSALAQVYFGWRTAGLEQARAAIGFKWSSGTD